MWREIEGYAGLYEVSDAGEVASLRFNHSNKRRIIKQSRNTNGYMIVKLYKHGAKKTVRVHRLVAMAFIKKPNGKNQVNHKDGDKTNNSVKNLEWVDNSENQLHSFQKLGNSYSGQGISVKIADKTTGKIYSSISETARAIGVSRRTIANSKRFRRTYEN